MQKNSVVEVVRSLNDSGVRYLIAGGLAVVAHGYLRLTADVARQEVASGVEAVFLGFEDLIRLKQDAGRPKDLDDISKLKILREGGHG